MDLVNLGGKLLHSVRSRRALSFLGSQSDRPEVPARAAAAAAVARTLAGLPPHQRLQLQSTLGGSPSLYGGLFRGERLEDVDERFYEQEFDPVRHALEILPDSDVDQNYFDAQVAQRLLQLDAITESLSRQVMEHHEEMVKGMQLVMELEKDLQVTTIICKNGRRHLSLAVHEVSQDLVVTSNVKKKQLLLEILPILVRIQHTIDVKSRLDSIVEEGNYAKALQMCSICMQLMDECSGVFAVADMNRSIEQWLQCTLEKVDGVLLEVCRKFDGDDYKMVIDAYAMIDDGGLGEKVQNCFVQIVVIETHTVLKTFLYEGEDPGITQKKSRLPYNDLCLQLPEPKFRLCLHKTLEVLFDLMCSYYAMMSWQPPQKDTGDAVLAKEKPGALLNGKHKHSDTQTSMCEHSPGDQHCRNVSFPSLESESCLLDQSHLHSSVSMMKGLGNDLVLSEKSLGKEKNTESGCSSVAEIGQQVQYSFILENQDLAKDLDDAVNKGSLSDVTERLRRETSSHVSKALEKGRKHVWELAARRVSALLSSDAVCNTSPHHFLLCLDWVNKFVLAGEAFSGAEALSLRAKLLKLCEKYFGTFHRQNLEVLRMMLEKETWQQLSPEAMKAVNLTSLLGNGAPALSASPVMLSKNKVFDRIHHSEVEGATAGLSRIGKEQGGFAACMDRGNPFIDRKHEASLLLKGVSQTSESAAPCPAALNGKERMDAVGNGLQKSVLLSGTSDNGVADPRARQLDDIEEEDQDLLADFIDEDSQLPSRVYGNVSSGSSGILRDKHIHPDDEDWILTGSSVSILRYMDKYARLMQILQLIATDVFRGFCQLFELYFFFIFKTFGQRDAFGGGRGQADCPNMITARLRAALVRISQGLEEQRSKNATASVIATSVAGSNQPGHPEGLQTGLPMGSVASSFSASNLFGIKERYAAAESLSSLAEMLKKLRTHLQSIVPQDALATVDNFYSRTVDAVADLKEHIYKTAAKLLLNIGGYVDRIANVRWEVKELGMEHNGYVDLLLGEFKIFSSRLSQGGISKEIHELLLEYGVDTLAETLLEGFSRVKKCTNEGRALMSLDLQVLINGLRHLAPSRLSSNLHIVESYVKAFYLPETEYVHWVRAHPEYAKGQVIGLVNLVASTNNWKRKTRVEILEKIEAGEI
eukprot:c28500_g1_i1 orf=1413-4874(+)